MKNKSHHKQKDILFILGSSLIVVIFWIASNIVHIWATTTVSEELQLRLTPIPATFDTDTLQKLKTRLKVDPLYERQTGIKDPAGRLISPTPTPLPTPLDTLQEEIPASNSSRFAPEDTQILLEGQ